MWGKKNNHLRWLMRLMFCVSSPFLSRQSTGACSHLVTLHRAVHFFMLQHHHLWWRRVKSEPPANYRSWYEVPHNVIYCHRVDIREGKLSPEKPSDNSKTVQVFSIINLYVSRIIKHLKFNTRNMKSTLKLPTLLAPWLCSRLEVFTSSTHAWVERAKKWNKIPSESFQLSNNSWAT
jgi:hypothetical protein